MTAPIVNVPLLRKAVEWVEAQAELPIEDREWDQGHWRRTPEDRALATLVAGCDCDDCQRTRMRTHPCGTTYCVAGHIAEEAGCQWSSSSSVNGRAVAEVAAELLSIDEREADRLFLGGNTAADVRRIAEHIAGERL